MQLNKDYYRYIIIQLFIYLFKSFPRPFGSSRIEPDQKYKLAANTTKKRLEKIREKKKKKGKKKSIISTLISRIQGNNGRKEDGEKKGKEDKKEEGRSGT